MDWKTLYLDASGRIGRKDFWLGVALLIVAGMILGLIPVVGSIIGLALLWPQTCLMSKRLHDFGKSGMLAAIPLVTGAVFNVLALASAVMLAGAAVNPMAGAGALGLIGVVAVLSPLALLVSLAFLLWVGLSKSDPAVNQYGAPRATDLIPVKI